MASIATGRMPRHLWVVGILSLVWNAFGAFDYTMTQTRNEAYLAQFTAEQIAYFTSFPAWMTLFWALGVWGALLGSLLLFARSRYAVAAFGMSLIGLAVSSIYQHLVADMPEDLMGAGAKAVTIAIWIVAIFLIAYASHMRRRGVLR